MSAILVYYDKEYQKSEMNEVFAEIKNWQFIFRKADHHSFEELQKDIDLHYIDFLICSTAFSKNLAKNLYYLHANKPLLMIIYFNSIINDSEFSQFFRAGVTFCFVGEKRQMNLHTALNKLISEHWQKIPKDLLPDEKNKLPERSRRIIYLIENSPLKNCNSEYLAYHLNISQSHFRKEFRNYFRINFREFKQRLIQHYENVLLFERNLKPGHIYQKLDYKNLSAFSRSFKTRHGVSWQNLAQTKD